MSTAWSPVLVVSVHETAAWPPDSGASRTPNAECPPSAGMEIG